MTDLTRILHVDDEDDIRFIVQMALEMPGEIQVMSCASGAEALKEAALFQPQLFLLDFMMPEMNGEETWEKLASLEGLAETPTIFMTAKAERSTTERLVALGALSVITKPFEASEICNIIKDLWTRSLQEVQN